MRWVFSRAFSAIHLLQGAIEVANTALRTSYDLVRRSNRWSTRPSIHAIKHAMLTKCATFRPVEQVWRARR